MAQLFVHILQSPHFVLNFRIFAIFSFDIMANTAPSGQR